MGDSIGSAGITVELSRYMQHDVALFVAKKLLEYDKKAESIRKIEIRQDKAFVIKYFDIFANALTFVIQLASDSQSKT